MACGPPLPSREPRSSPRVSRPRAATPALLSRSRRVRSPARANGYGLWREASVGFEHTAGLPGADRGMLLARAAADARLGGDDERYRQLLAQAKALDEGHAQVVLASSSRSPGSG